jgi:hypothetical protein
VLDWLTEMVSALRNEYPTFPAALSLLMLLGPQPALAALQRRAESLRERLATLDAELRNYFGNIPRVTLLEVEYQRTITAAALAWVDGIVEDLARGSLTWSREDFSAAGDASRSRTRSTPRPRRPHSSRNSRTVPEPKRDSTRMRGGALVFARRREADWRPADGRCICRSDQRHLKESTVLTIEMRE